MSRSAFAAWTACMKEDRPGVFATVLEVDSGAEVRTGSHLFVSEEGNMSGSLGDSVLDREVAEVADEKYHQLYPKSETRTFKLDQLNVTVFIDVNVPPSEVMIFGAGHDAIPVASIARQLGFRTTVIDQRPAYATEERFPGVRLILSRPEQLEEKVEPGRRTYIVIMNHHIEKDQMCLRFALQSISPYVGVLGPRKRRNRMLDALREQGVTFTESQLSRMYNPVGLDIGADTSEEIAVSILSEILTVRNQHGGGHLREREAIHEPIEKG